MNNKKQKLSNDICNNKDEIDKYIKEKMKLNNLIVQKNSEVFEMVAQIKEIDKKLNKICKHKWLPDYTYRNEHTTYSCQYCKLTSN